MSYDVFAGFYDALTDNVGYGGKAEFLNELMQKYKPGCRLIVDLACGTGSLSVRLAGMGYDVIGVDISPEMLMKAREKSPADILYLCQPMQRLDLYGTVDAMVCVLDSVNHITKRQTLQEAFRRVSLFLEPDGVFIFDANTVYKHEKILASNTFVYDTENVYCVWQNQPGRDGIIGINLDFFEREADGLYSRSSEEFSEKAYSHEELLSMLGEAGLTVCEEFDDYSYDAPKDTTERIVYVCMKSDRCGKPHETEDK